MTEISSLAYSAGDMAAGFTLDLKNTFVGLASEKAAIAPSAGSLFYETDTGTWWVWNTSGAWVAFTGFPTGAGGGGALAAQVQGNVAAGATDSGNPVKVGGKHNTTVPTLTNGQRGDFEIGTRGSQHVTLMPANSATPVTTGGYSADGLGTVTNLLVGAFLYGWNGGSADRLRLNTTGIHVARRKVAVSVTTAAAGDYAAGDVVSNSATGDAGVAASVPAIVDTAGQVARLVGVMAKCTEDSVVWRLRLHFYDYNPAAADVEMDDNIAADFAKNATGLAGYKGYVDLPAMADFGTSMAMAQVDDMKKLIATNLTTGLWMVIQTLDAEVNETAAQVLTFDLLFES